MIKKDYKLIGSGNPIVDAVGDMNIRCSLNAPEPWYKAILTSKGYPDNNAINILGDIVYGYHPKVTIDPQTKTITYHKKFYHPDYLQRDVLQLAQKFNLSERQVSDTIRKLEKMGLIKRHTLPLITNNFRAKGVDYIELFPTKLKELTYSSTKTLSNTSALDHKKMSKNTTKNCNNSQQKNVQYSPKICQPYTNNKKNTPILTTTTHQSVVDEAKILFASLNLPDEDILAITEASDYDIARCKKAFDVLQQQTQSITNVTGWLISAIRRNYRPVNKAPAQKKNSFNTFHQRKYKHGELENILLNSSLK